MQLITSLPCLKHDSKIIILTKLIVGKKYNKYVIVGKKYNKYELIVGKKNNKYENQYLSAVYFHLAGNQIYDRNKNVFSCHI